MYEEGKIRVSVLAVVLAALLLVSIGVIAGIYETKSAQAYGGAAVDAATKSGTLSLVSGTSATYTLPRKCDPYEICARGNRVYITCDNGTPTATTSPGGYAFSVPDGACSPPRRFYVEKCAYIATSATSEVEFIHHNPLIGCQ